MTFLFLQPKISSCGNPGLSPQTNKQTKNSNREAEKTIPLGPIEKCNVDGAERGL